MGALSSVRGDLGRGLAVARFGKFPNLRRPADALVFSLHVLPGFVGAVRLNGSGRRCNLRRWLCATQARGAFHFDYQRTIRREHRHAFRRFHHDAHGTREPRDVLAFFRHKFDIAF